MSEYEKWKEAKEELIKTIFGNGGESDPILTNEKRPQKEDPKTDFDAHFSYDLCSHHKVDKEENMDIFSSQVRAAKKAHRLFERIKKNAKIIKVLIGRLTEFQTQLDNTQGKGEDTTERQSFKPDACLSILIIGASVTGLSFHATLIKLFEEYKTDFQFELDELFAISFVDAFKRPMERLYQARNRTIVPRYEYERLLEMNISADGTCTPGDVASDIFNKCLSKTTLEDEFLNLFQPLETDEAKTPFISDEEIYPLFWNKDTSHLPKELFWPASPVQDVVTKIYNGYAKIVGFDPGYNNSMSTQNLHFHYLNHIYLGNSEGKKQFFLKAQLKRQRRDKKESQNNNKFAKMLNENTHSISGRSETIQKIKSTDMDLVLFATGLGVDVAPKTDEITLIDEETIRWRTGSPEKEAIDENANDDRVYDFENSQRSYWDPIRVELELLEANMLEVLIIGNKDSVAGAIYSFLLVDRDTCSFRALYQLLTKSCSYDKKSYQGKKSPLQTAFAKLQTAVNNHPNSDKEKISITAQWKTALQYNPDINEVQFALDELIQTAALDAGDAIRQIIRSDRNIVVGIRKKDELENNTYEKTLLNNGWPENKLLVSLLSSYLSVQVLDYGIETPKFNIVRRRNDLRSDYFELLETDDKGEMSTIGTYKYVLNCAGQHYVSAIGNHKTS